MHEKLNIPKKLQKEIFNGEYGMVDEQIIMAPFASSFRFQSQTDTSLKNADCQSFDMNIYNFIE